MTEDASLCAKILEEKGAAAGIGFTGGELEKFALYYDLLCEKNKVMNLTALLTPEDAAVKHFLDCLLILDPRLKKARSFIDVGTGAGFPAIPVKIMRPDLPMVLVDSLGKRINFLEEAAETLGLSGMTFLHMRAEDAGQDKDLRERFDFAAARAVASLAVLSEYCLPLVKKGGWFAAMKGAKAKDEALEAKRAIKELGGALAEEKEVFLPDLPDKRYIIYIRKEKKTPSCYPRRAGTPSSRPL